MSKPATHNARAKIVSLPPRGQHSPGARVFAECRERLLEQLSEWLRGMATPIAEEFFTLADTTRDRTQQTRYLDLRAAIEKDWAALVDNFRREFTAAVERHQRPADALASMPDRPLEPPDVAGLTLLDDDELAKHIVVREFAAMLSESCMEELYLLERRVAALLGLEEASSEANPLAPEVLCHALSEACVTFVADSEARLLLLRRLQRHLQLALPTIYQKINAQFVEHGVLPDLKRNYRRDVRGETKLWPGTVSSAAATAAQTAAPNTTPGLAGGEPAPPSGEAILIALQRLAQARSERLSVPLATPPGPTANSGEARLARPFDAQAINQLLFSSLDQLQHAPSSAPGELMINRVQELRTSESAQLAGGLEAVTIDIIAMLFDFIFDDAHIPVAIKALVSRLQIPVLKVAMLNPDFFADRQHPTRRFLGSISGISIRWGDSVDENDPFFRKLAELVERIQNEFENDIGVFGTALAELEAFVMQRQSEDEDTALSAAHSVNLREQKNAAWKRAQQAAHVFFREAKPPPLIVNFVSEHWLAVLQAAAINDEDQDGQASAWRAAEQAMNDLAWSVEPKRSADDRLKLITLLPALLAFLKNSLMSVSVPAEQSQSFFDALLPYHAAALKGDATPPAGLPTTLEDSGQDAATPASHSDGDLLVTRSVDDGIEIEEVMLVGASPLWRPDDQEIYRQVSELKRGDWVEFAQLDEFNDREGSDGFESAGKLAATRRERLNWISPQRAVLLFSNHQSAKAISISPEALARKIRDGKARLIHHGEIFERALSGALESANSLDR